MGASAATQGRVRPYHWKTAVDEFLRGHRLDHQERMAVALENISASQRRLADHLAPAPSDIVDTPYIARHLGCTTQWIAQMVRSGEIPRGCVVPGSGKGRQWKFYRCRIEDWLAKQMKGKTLTVI